MIEVPQTYQDLKTLCTKDQDGQRQRVRWLGQRLLFSPWLQVKLYQILHPLWYIMP
jgi:hypothetical protein